ncbi:MAG TPA: flagellar hook-length control protein FliK [Azospirillaceae bacterium]|nr:flagellar hook-length control protein FliK [Azospirillaceae bacterium]
MDINPINPLSGFDPARVGTVPGSLADDMFANMLGEMFVREEPAPAPKTAEPPAKAADRSDRPAAKPAARPVERQDTRPAPRPQQAERPAKAADRAEAKEVTGRGDDAAQTADDVTRADDTKAPTEAKPSAKTADTRDETDNDTATQAGAEAPMVADAAAEPEPLVLGADFLASLTIFGGLDENTVAGAGDTEADAAAVADLMADPAVAQAAMEMMLARAEAAALVAAQAAAAQAGQHGADDQTADGALADLASAQPLESLPMAGHQNANGAIPAPHDPDLPADAAAGTGAGADIPAEADTDATEADFANLLQAARGMARGEGRNAQGDADSRQERAGDGQSQPQANGDANAGRNVNLANAPQSPMATDGASSAGTADGVDGLQSSQTASRAADSSHTLPQGGEGVRPAGGQDFASHLKGLQTLRGGAPTHAPVTDQVQVQLKRGIKDGMDQMTINLRPDELGRIEVRLEFGADGRVAARISAENAQTLELLQKDSRSLERALQEAGLKADSGSLSFNLRGGNDGRHAHEQQDQGGGFGSGGRSRGEDFEEDMNDTLARMPVRTLTLAPGRVDVRI